MLPVGTRHAVSENVTDNNIYDMLGGHGVPCPYKVQY